MCGWVGEVWSRYGFLSVHVFFARGTGYCVRPRQADTPLEGFQKYRNVTMGVGVGARVSVTKPHFPFIKGQTQCYDGWGGQATGDFSVT